MHGTLLHRAPILLGRLAFGLSSGATNAADPPIVWRHFTIADPLPGNAWGTAGIPLADLDGDPDLVTKIWNKDGAAYHADFWRNDRIPTRN